MSRSCGNVLHFPRDMFRRLPQRSMQSALKQQLQVQHIVEMHASLLLQQKIDTVHYNRNQPLCIILEVHSQ
eukprot:432822-Amphidinium_carterae.1